MVEEAKKILEEWNNGVYRGAQRRLARELFVTKNSLFWSQIIRQTNFKKSPGFGALKTPKPGPFYFYVFDLTFCQKTFIL